MKLLINFIVESGISLAFLGTLYYVFLRKETFFLQNRIFLFFAIVFSAALPLLHIRIYEPQVLQLPEITVTPEFNYFQTFTAYSQEASKELEQTISSSEIVLWAYLIGVLLLSLRLLWKCVQIYRLKHKGSTHKIDGVSVVVTDAAVAPFAFLNMIFIPQNLEKKDGYNQILLHEMEHVKQRHSYDILIVELLTILQWCNPFVWLLKRAIHENHEYLADKAVLAAGTERGHYKLLLLNQCLGEAIFIASPFNYSLIKNRIKMMNKMKSHKMANLKYLLGLFIAAVLVVGFALENKLSAESPELMASQKDKNIEQLPFKKADVAVEIGENSLSFKGGEKDLRAIMKMMSHFGGKNIAHLRTPKEGDSELSILTFTKEGISGNTSKSKQHKPVNDNKKTFVRVEQMPQYPGGIKALMQFLGKNVIYPKEAVDKKIQGKVYLRFVVKENGEVGEVEVLRNPDELLTQEAIRVVKTLKNFKPAMQGGKPVRCWYQMPVTFRLLDKKDENKKEKL